MLELRFFRNVGDLAFGRAWKWFVQVNRYALPYITAVIHVDIRLQIVVN